MRHTILALSILLAVQTAVASEPAQRILTFEDRIQAQKAIEQVYWNHRIWPKENPGAKPPLVAVMSDTAIRAKVEDYLKKSNAIEAWWQRPITGEQLQAEMDRMAKGSHDAQALGELFAALGNDPFMIAETLARQTLADRLIRNWYGSDPRFQGEVRTQAEAALTGTTGVAKLKTLGGEYTEWTVSLRRDVENPSATVPGNRAVELDPEEWKEWTSGLSRQFGTMPDAVPLRRLSPLREDADGFSVVAVLSRGDGEVVMAAVRWAKRSFDSWWSTERTKLSATVAAEPAAYVLTERPSGGCVDDTWLSHFYVPTPRQLHSAVWTGTEMIIWGGWWGSTWDEYGIPLNTGGRYNPATDTWAPTSTGANVPDARREPVAVWTGTEMIVWGGGSQSGGRYHPSTDTWTPMSTDAYLPAAAGATAVWTGTEMIVWGGGSSAGARYRPAADRWMPTSTGADAPTGFYYHSAVWTGTEMIVWGGVSGSATVNTGSRYDPSTDRWTATSVGAGVPSPRGLHKAVWTGTEMIIWGGDAYAGHFTTLNTGGRYNPATNTWTATSVGAGVPASRSEHTAVWTGTEMIVWGGANFNLFSSGTLNTGGRYNPSTNAWTATAVGADAPSVRYLHTAVWTGTEMIIWGGGEVRFPVFDTGGRYQPSTNSWVATATGPGVPEGRGGHTAAWTGAEMIVWGGTDNPLIRKGRNTGGIFHPATDHWTATSVGDGVPSARYLHTAVWTGTRLVVWGGAEGNEGARLNTGGRFDPATGLWSATSVGANTPSARSGHTAVWAGTEMIVWGGQNGPPFADGGRYNPATDGWSAVTTIGAPSARYNHTAVWTPGEMIVWGGAPVGAITGGRYNPITEHWIATSTGENVPSARSGHVAVWTGVEMIVWGPGPGPGGRYDPSTDSWTATSTGANQPSGSGGNTAVAVWTGKEMVVWGGGFWGNPSNTGGRYDPSTDTWTATSTGPSAPSARTEHTAVWTGTEMIVWGGFPTTRDLSRYCACSYRDDDGDGYSECQGDCNDANAAVYPGAPEICDGVKDDCSDPGPAMPPNEADADGDGVRVCSGDCDDTRASVYPGALQLCDGVNNNCSDPAWPAVPANETDADLDGFSICNGDCNDANPAIHPGASETCNLIDDNCDGVIDNPGSALCNDDNACTNDVCNGAAGCTHVNNTAACNDANACTTNDFCGGGICHAGTAVVCGDDNACTTDGCNPAMGCVFTSNTAACDDGNPCTTADGCSAGACVGGPALICGDDGDACTPNVCVPTSGCVASDTNLDPDPGGFSEARVDGRDLVVLADAWNSCPNEPNYNVAANLDQMTTLPDACVGDTDFHLFMNAFGHSCPP